MSVCSVVLSYDSEKKYKFWCCVAASAAAPTADHVDKWVKSAGQTTITNFLLVKEHQDASVPLPLPQNPSLFIAQKSRTQN